MPTTVPFALQIHGVPFDALRVLSFRGSEAMSRLFRFDIEVRTTAPAGVDLEPALFGRDLRLTLHAAGGNHRVVGGIVTRVASLGIDRRGFERLSLRLEPKLALLRRRRGCRIFQDLSVPQIAGKILEERAIDHTVALLNAHAPWPYCVQYHESELGFLRRVLAEVGMLFFFEPPAAPDAGSRLVVCDDAAFYRELPGAMPVVADVGLHAGEDHIHAFGVERAIASGKAHLRGHDWRRPSLTLTGDAAVRDAVGFDESPLEAYDHQEGFDGPHVDEALAKVHLGQHRRDQRVARGESSSRRIFPGARFALEGHPIARFDGDWAVVAVEHEGSAPDVDEAAEAVYRNTFRAVPGDHGYRPRRPKRRVQQTQETATVVGPKGREMYVDGEGRIKVQFHWDREGARDEHTSCWLRVMQPWAGAGWGSQFIPRVGMEVVVSLSCGDADMPMVLGSVYNGSNRAPFALPAHETKSGIRTQSFHDPRRHNELSFDDRHDHERVHLRAQRDLDVHALGSRGLDVGGSDTVRIAGLATRHVGDSEVRIIAKNDMAMIGGQYGRTIGRSARIQIGENLDAEIDGNARAVVGATSSLAVGGELGLNLGALRASVGDTSAISAGHDVHLDAGRTMTLSAGGAFGLRAGGNLSLSSAAMVEITAANGITLTCGTSVVQIKSDEIVMKADSISMVGQDKIAVQGSSSSMKFDGDVTADAGTITLTGLGSKAELGGDATLTGGSVKLKSGSGQSSSTDQPGSSQPAEPPKLAFAQYVGIGNEDSSRAALVVRDGDGEELGRPAAVERSAGHLTYEIDPDAYDQPIAVFFVDDHGDEHHLAGPVDPKRLRRAMVDGDLAGSHRLAGRRGASRTDTPGESGIDTMRAVPRPTPDFGPSGGEVDRHLEEWGEDATEEVEA